MTAVEKSVSGWGRLAAATCRVARPASRSQLRQLIAQGGESNYIARGLGRSYGDAAVNQDGGVILQSGLNQFLSFDDQTGILDCEAGLSLAEIMMYLLPRGWFLPTTPGTRHVTVGGAIAADVHGKNHHLDGAFGNFVLELQLLTAGGQLVGCSSRHNADLFWATVGGMGLTGVIASARIQLRRVATAYVDVRYRGLGDIDAVLQALAAADGSRYSVAWVDGTRSGRSLGRSILMQAEDAGVNDLPAFASADPLGLPRRRQMSVPNFAPGFLLRPRLVRSFNSYYYARHRNHRQIVDYNSFFYPLDSIQNWNRLYGRRGFVQYQVLFPHGTARTALVETFERVASSGQTPYLGVLKRCGAAGQGLLSFPYPGITLALDFPATGRPLTRLLGQLDETTLKFGGRLYLAKDATTSADAFAEMYPRWEEFKRLKHQVDPTGRFASSQARRLGLVESNTGTGCIQERRVA